MIRVRPRSRGTLFAIRWDHDNWRQVMAFMGKLDDGPEPDVLIDSDGDEFTCGMWLVRVSQYRCVSFTDAQFRSLYEVVQ